MPFPDAGTLALFLVAALALLVVPGPAVVYIVAQSIDQGRVAGLVSTLGLGAGSLVHVAAAGVVTREGGRGRPLATFGSRRS